MLNEKHDLIHELPEHREVDHEIHLMEAGVENTSDEYLEGCKKQRLHL
ncbi:MAG: YdcH family protein [Gammaproteobacteria bacterium]|nr:YdcH family protein [Gammaproteobacteria bacterium]